MRVVACGGLVVSFDVLLCCLVCATHILRGLLCVVCALHRFPKLWFDATVPASFLSSLSLLPLAAGVEAPVDFMDCFHAYMRLHIEEETASDSSMASVLS